MHRDLLKANGAPMAMIDTGISDSVLNYDPFSTLS